MSVIINMLKKAKEGKHQPGKRSSGNNSYMASADLERESKYRSWFLWFIVLVIIIAVVCIFLFYHENQQNYPAQQTQEVADDSVLIAGNTAVVVDEPVSVDSGSDDLANTSSETIAVESVEPVEPAEPVEVVTAPQPADAVEVVDVIATAKTGGTINPPVAEPDKASNQAKPVDYYQQILFAINQQHLTEAMALMEQQVQTPKQYQAIQQKLLTNLLLTNRSAIALLFGKQALNYIPQATEVRLLTATAASRLDKVAWAYQVLDQWQPVVTNSEDYYALKGMLALKLKSYSPAQHIYRVLVQAFPNKPNYLLGLAIAEQGLGNKEMALVYYNRLKNSQAPTWPSWYFVNTQIQALQ